jgi:hypothetical protein
MKIFVSYTLRDGILNMQRLKGIESILKQFGDPYIDLLHNQSLNPQRHVVTMLYKSSVLLAFLTPRFYESNWVQLELMIAKIRGIPIINLDLMVNAKLSLRNLPTHQANPQLTGDHGSSEPLCYISERG